MCINIVHSFHCSSIFNTICSYAISTSNTICATSFSNIRIISYNYNLIKWACVVVFSTCSFFIASTPEVCKSIKPTAFVVWILNNCKFWSIWFYNNIDLTVISNRKSSNIKLFFQVIYCNLFTIFVVYSCRSTFFTVYRNGNNCVLSCAKFNFCVWEFLFCNVITDFQFIFRSTTAIRVHCFWKISWKFFVINAKLRSTFWNGCTVFNTIIYCLLKINTICSHCNSFLLFSNTTILLLLCISAHFLKTLGFLKTLLQMFTIEGKRNGSEYRWNVVLNDFRVFIIFCLLSVLKTPHPNPALNYSGEHNISMTSKPEWLLLVISILFALTGFRPTENSLSCKEWVLKSLS